MNITKIVGEFNTAICYASVIEEEAVEQIRTMCNYDFTKDSRICIMPDVHAGKGCTIGTTMTITDKVVPNIVGVDIGCGILTVELEDKVVDFEKFDEVAHYIPSGKKVWDIVQEKFDLTELKCYRELSDKKWLERSIGTLGGGNHFIEIDRSENGTNYLVIHSGSRNLGKQVCEFYQKIAIDLQQGKEEYYKRKDEIIKTYKEQGKKKDIQDALRKLKWERKESIVPDDLCYLYGRFLEDYLHDVNVCQHFAKRNRELISRILLRNAGLTCKTSFHTIHNYINTDEMILRKGAIAAHSGEMVLIPINMRDGSILAFGKGNPEWNYSAPHGAGRVMSRKKTKENISLEEYKSVMSGIYSTSVNEFTLDEAPMAYKSLNDIIDIIGKTVDIISVLKPVYNFKASE